MRPVAMTPQVIDELPLFGFLPADARADLAGRFTSHTFAFGAPIVREGDPSDAFYILVSGKARVVKHAGQDGRHNGEISLGHLKPGDFFGERGLLAHSTRTATVRASADTEVLRLDKRDFDAMIEERPELRQYFELQVARRELHNFFREFTAFAKLPPSGLQRLLESLEPVEVPQGEVVIREGDPPGPMYIVREGRLRVFRDIAGRRQYIGYLRKGDFFGELSVLKNEPRAASIEAVAQCELMLLRRETLQALLEELPEFRARIEERISQYNYRQTARVPLDFAQEMLPAAVQAIDKVGPDQVDEQFGSGAMAAIPDSVANNGGPAHAKGAEADDVASKTSKRTRIRRFPIVRQVDEMDCGAASLAMVCRHYGRAVSLARIRHLVHTSLDGTSLRGICHAATELGLAARSVKASPRTLEQLPLPAIVHSSGNHWVVLYDVDATHVRIADPASGKVQMTRAEFTAKWSGYAALFDYTTDFERAPLEQSNVAWLWPFFKPYKSLLAKALALAGIISALQMVLPVFTQIVVDRVLVEQDVGLLNLLIGGMVMVLVFMTSSVIVQRYLMSFAAVRIDASTLDFLTRKLLALPMSYFNTRRTGDIQRRLEGIRQIREFIVQRGVTGLSAAVQLVATLVLMVVYSPKLALVFLTTMPIYVALMRFSARRLRPLFDKLEESYGRYHSYQIDAIKGIETVKAMGAEPAFRELMLGQFHSVSKRRFAADFTTMSYNGIVQMVAVLSTTLFLWFGAMQVMRGSLSIGALVAFNSLVALANAPIMILLGLWDSLQMASILLGRLNDVFEQDPEQGADHTRLLPVPSLSGHVAFEKMGFRYGGPESPPILDDISVEVPPNTMVAIVGRSGSGKTTLIKCLSGLLEPTSGTIAYDGIDMRTLNYRDLRRQIGFVLQENHLFDDTIARNIAFGEAEPNMDNVLWAARMANAHEFIERLPLGYETKVGESGLSISGGQRQRIAIARALYHQPPILVFDEATSALDTESERAVKDNLASLMNGRTSFVIAHRLSTVRDAGMILVLEKGRLVERGTHDELMKHQGLYYYLVSQQLSL